MNKRFLVMATLVSLTQLSAAQLPKIKIPGTDRRINTQRASADTPTVTGVTGTCKNGASREIVIKVANVPSNLMSNVKVESHPPYEVTATKVGDGEVHVTLKDASPANEAAQYGALNPGPSRCDVTLKFYKNPGDQYPARELYAGAKADANDAYLAQLEKQKQQQAEQQKQIDAAQAEYKKAQPAVQEHQHASVGDKWTVHWASGQTEVWKFSGFDPNMSTMAVFKGPGGDVKIMFAGMFYQVIMGQCAAMAQPDGQGKVSGKTMGGTCSQSGAFTATIE